jgi:hypothetical protein
MKYLAAYALLALSGKKDISTHLVIQPPRTSKPSSVASHRMPLTKKSIKSSPPPRENPSISSSTTGKRDSEAPPPLPSQPRRRTLPRRRRRRRNPKRSNSPRRRLLRRLLKNNKTQISEICSDDTHTHIYSFPTANNIVIQDRLLDPASTSMRISYGFGLYLRWSILMIINISNEQRRGVLRTKGERTASGERTTQVTAWQLSMLRSSSFSLQVSVYLHLNSELQSHNEKLARKAKKYEQSIKGDLSRYLSESTVRSECFFRNRYTHLLNAPQNHYKLHF